MNKFPLTLIFTLLTACTFGQTLIVTDTKGKKKKKIKIGRIVTVVTKDDSIANPFHHYVDSTRNKGSYCPDGCFRLAAIDVENNTFTIAYDSVRAVYKVEDVNLIRYVKAKHPHGVYAFRVGVMTVGVLSIVGRTITVANDDSPEEKITDYLIGGAFIGVSAMIRSNLPKTYRLIGIEK